MYIKEALRELNLFNELPLEWKKSLDENGYFVVEKYFNDDVCQEMGDEFDRLHSLEGEQGGHEVHIEPTTKRISNIFNKTTIFDRCLNIEPLLSASHYMLGEFKIHGANLREPKKNGGHQKIHVDVPKKFNDDWWVCNAIIAIDEITLGNGPPRVIPGSHYWQTFNVAYVNIHDWVPEPLSDIEKSRIPKDLEAPYPGELHVSCPKGSVIIINSALWHGGTCNKSGERRRVLHLTYTRRDLPQQLVQRQYLTSNLYDRLNRAQRFIMDIEPISLEIESSLRMKSAGKKSAGDWWNPET